MLAVAGDGDEGLKDLLGWQTDLVGHGDGSEVVGVNFVGAKLVGDFELVEETGGVGLGGFHVCGLRAGDDAALLEG